MSVVSAKTIICTFDSDTGHWVAHFECAPQVIFNGAVPMSAVHGLLEGTVVAPGRYPLDCEAASGVPGAEYRIVQWNPPNIALEVGAKEPPDWQSPDFPVFGVDPAGTNPSDPHKSS